jgi:alpha-galactosidase
VLVFPGITRAANARQALGYDEWIPSTLFLTHYLPDDPAYAQWINLGSLILRQNGIWGVLPEVSKDGIERFNTTLSRYKQGRSDITKAYPIRKGVIGGSPEKHEKINTETGKGIEVIFYNYKNAWRRSAENVFPGTFSYITENKPNNQIWSNIVSDITFYTEGHAVIHQECKASGAVIIFFGVE